MTMLITIAAVVLGAAGLFLVAGDPPRGLRPTKPGPAEAPDPPQGPGSVFRPAPRGWPVTRPMAQNYDPKTGIAIMGACMEGCSPSCVPRCVLDPERCTSMVYGPPGMEFEIDPVHAALMDEHREKRRRELAGEDVDE